MTQPGPGPALGYRHRFVRFLASGAVNTLLTYALYLACLQYWSYRFSYTVAYIAGIGLAYFLNRLFVFKEHRGVASVLLLPMIYVVQYLAGIGILWVWVDWIGLPSSLGPLAVIFFTVPLTYLLTRFAFVKK